MYSTTDFRRGLKIEIDKEPYEIIGFQHVKPGKGGAFVRTKLKGLRTGRTIDRRFNAGERVEEPDLAEKTMQYLYREGDAFHFMDKNDYEQMVIDKEHLGSVVDFMKENIDVKILFYESKPIGVEIPSFVEFEVVETVPGHKGDTATGGSKPAKLETGTTVQVPLFVNEGDRVRIDTRDGTYIERLK